MGGMPYGEAMATRMKRFAITLIKPSRYDSEGYVIQWRRSCIPSNSLGCLYGMARDCVERQVLGPDVEISYSGYDEPAMVIPIRKVIAEMQTADKALLCLVGVQSNQFPRAMHIARRFRAAGIDVAIGGFHVSGCLAMLKDIPADIQEAIDLGCTIFAGEAEEGRFEELLKAVWEGTAKSVYNYMDALPNLVGAPTPFLPDNVLNRGAARYMPFDSGRGCPYQCSFCSIINVQGRKSRWRSPDDIEALLRENWSRGVKRLLITDDNFARNKDWELVLDRMIEMRKEGIKFRFFIQVDALCHKTEGFIEKCAQAGCNWVYIGLENINPENLMAAKKRQNKIWEYRRMLQEWKKHGVQTYCGYITGFPFDTPESIARDVEIIKRELAIEVIEFFYLTPLPGSEDHKRLTEAGTWMDPDMNKYALSHRVTHHAKMTDEGWERAFEKAWRQYYNHAHVRTIMRRIAVQRKPSVFNSVWPLLWFWSTHLIERVHPVEAGYLRVRVRTERRPGMRIEPPLIFYPKHWARTVINQARTGWLLLTLLALAWSVRREVRKNGYVDASIRPVTDDREAFDQLEMIHTHGAAANALQRAHIHTHEHENSREREPLIAAE
jgi:tRNA A37 methylthiotransferase MiaB